jgi:hypothetical protein
VSAHEHAPWRLTRRLPYLPGPDNPELFHAKGQRRAVQAQADGCPLGAREHPFGLLQRRQDEGPLTRFERLVAMWRRLIPERGSCDTGCTQRGFALVVGDRSRLARRATWIEGYPLARQARQPLLGCIRPDPVRACALSLADFLDAQLPRHMHARSSGRSENVGCRVEEQMILAVKHLDIMLHHQATADDLDVDGHALAVRCRRISCGHMRW